MDINGKRVVSDSQTNFVVQQQRGVLPEPAGSVNLHIGQSVDVYGGWDGKAHAIRATHLRIYSPRAHDVPGMAVIEAVLPPSGSSSSDELVRADGYKIRITSDTKTKFVAPLSSSNDIQTNVMMKYEGKQETDGVVVAKSVTFYKNQISDSMSKIGDDWDYDPHDVPSNSHQSRFSKAFRGTDASMFPLHKDAAMQQRISTIGNKLIPAYQKSLSPKDPTRINFRFYLVDAPKVRDAFALPSGIILVPYQVAGRMKNDSQLAAVLADKIALLAEEQPIPLPSTNGELAEGFGLMAVSPRPRFLKEWWTSFLKMTLSAQPPAKVD